MIEAEDTKRYTLLMSCKKIKKELLYALVKLLKAVKFACQYDNRIKYDGFLKLRRDFNAGKIDTKGVKSRVRRLLQGHPNLIYKFNSSLIFPFPTGSYFFYCNSHILNKVLEEVCCTFCINCYRYK